MSNRDMDRFSTGNRPRGGHRRIPMHQDPPFEDYHMIESGPERYAATDRGDLSSTDEREYNMARGARESGFPPSGRQGGEIQSYRRNQQDEYNYRPPHREQNPPSRHSMSYQSGSESDEEYYPQEQVTRNYRTQARQEELDMSDTSSQSESTYSTSRSHARGGNVHGHYNSRGGFLVDNHHPHQPGTMAWHREEDTGEYVPIVGYRYTEEELRSGRLRRPPRGARPGDFNY
ncbi:hypothetical protein H072_6678 [Dactylellina haptotyla CBS 200.50]|uniref:Uncharacterized protein n=1 Tax=Dactylellina haptotyla (strain CBS 200.50) TaxID=1284197 RepID=S8BW53_DACHA|nr:hypothetical protein H072_6678 [Dactylellina haptotyla CBS 200.50]